jgi:catechol 2,3-dioxygenase-like lactoylglutathione lyase family enzyme
MLVVTDVEASSRWYQDVLGLTSGHGGAEYEMLLFDGELVLQLHATDAHEHPQLGAPPSSGVAVWFGDADVDAVLARIAAAGAEIAEGPLVNPNAQHREVWLRDPDRHLVVVSSPYGDVAARPAS